MRWVIGFWSQFRANEAAPFFVLFALRLIGSGLPQVTYFDNYVDMAFRTNVELENRLAQDALSDKVSHC